MSDNENDKVDGPSYGVFWSSNDQEWVAITSKHELLSVLKDNPVEALRELIELEKNIDEGRA